MMKVGFYERRANELLIDFDDRRVGERRCRTLSVAMERRRSTSQERLSTRNPFNIVVGIHTEASPYTGQTVDLAPTGVLLISNAHLKPKTLLTLHLSFRYNACEVSLNGEVVSCGSTEERLGEKNPQNPNAIAIRFVDISEFEQRILLSAISDFGRNPLFGKMSRLDIVESDDAAPEELGDYFAETLSAVQDRRVSPRVKESLPVSLLFRLPGSKVETTWTGRTLCLSSSGFSVFTQQMLPKVEKGVVEMSLPNLPTPLRTGIRIIWADPERQRYGFELTEKRESERTAWADLVKRSAAPLEERRRRTGPPDPDRYDPLRKMTHEKRIAPRRFSDLQALEIAKRGKMARMAKTDLFPRSKEVSAESARTTREWLSAKTGADLSHLGFFTQSPEKMKGNIENFIGVTQIPVGVAGPLKINGGFARGTFYVPMATTEGTLVQSHAYAMQLLSLAGGVSTAFLKDETHITPLFKFDGVVSANLFVQWTETHFLQIKQAAEQTTKHGKLERLEPHLLDRNVALKFCYSTGDAMGSNMITLATEAACEYIVSIVKPSGYHIQSNFSSMKKITAHNFLSGYGRSVVAEAVIPADLLRRFYNTTPDNILNYYLKAVKSTLHAGMMGFSGHAANAITAIFIACGQDVANVVESHMGVSSCEVTPEGAFYISVKLPNLILGTAGGGVGLATQKECLDLLGCVGRGSAKKFAEIVCASVLAGEVGMYAANAGGTFVASFRGVRDRQSSESSKPLPVTLPSDHS